MKILRKGEPRPQMQKPIFIKLNQVGPYSTGCNLLVKILSIEEQSYTNYKGELFRVRVLYVGDDTATAYLRLIKEQYCQLQVGLTVALRNTRINIVKSKLRLEIDTWGKITVQEDEEVNDVNTENNISDVMRRERINQFTIQIQLEIGLIKCLKLLMYLMFFQLQWKELKKQQALLVVVISIRRDIILQKKITRQ